MLLLSAVVMLSAACRRQAPSLSANEEPIVAVAQGYLDAMANYNVDAAIPFASRETKESTIPFFRMMIAKTDSGYIRRNTPAEVHIDSVRIQSGDSTAIVFFTKTTPVQSKHQQLDLIKRNDTWQAHVLTAVPEVLKPHRPLTNKDLKDMHIQKVEKNTSPAPARGNGTK